MKNALLYTWSLHDMANCFPLHPCPWGMFHGPESQIISVMCIRQNTESAPHKHSCTCSKLCDPPNSVSPTKAQNPYVIDSQTDYAGGSNADHTCAQCDDGTSKFHELFILLILCMLLQRIICWMISASSAMQANVCNVHIMDPCGVDNIIMSGPGSHGPLRWR